MADSAAARGVGVQQGSVQMTLPGVTAPDGSQTAVTIAAGYRASALPSPQELAAYEAVTPGAADRILTMAERQLSHEHHFSKLTLWSAKISEVVGTLVGFTVAMVSICGGFALLWVHQNTAAAHVFMAGVAVIFGALGLRNLFDRKKKAPPA